MKIFRNILISLWVCNALALAFVILTISLLPDNLPNVVEVVRFWRTAFICNLGYLLLGLPTALISSLVYAIKSDKKWLLGLMIAAIVIFVVSIAYISWDIYQDSTLEETPDEYLYDDWPTRNFDTEHHCIALNNLWRITEDYNSLISVLADFYPIELPDDATPYQHYEVARQQFDSLLNFDPDGPTYMLYMWADLETRFDDITTKHFISELKKSGSYPDEMDEAWISYFNAMETVCDSVAMCRPCGQGTISQLESVSFMGHTYMERTEYLKSLYFAGDAAYNPERHRRISDQELADAFDAVYRHQRVYETTDPEFMDDVDSNVPLEEKRKALQADRKRYYELEELLIASGIDENALNILRRDKLILLKNMYRSFNIAEASFYDVLLPFDCTDDELRDYNFDESYKAVYGYYPKD